MRDDDQSPPDPPPGAHIVDPDKIVPIGQRSRGGHVRPGGRVRTFSYITEGPAVSQVDWLVKKIVPAHGIGMLVGKSGTGKTYVAMELALAVILGDDFDFGGRPIKRSGGVMWYAAEGGDYLKPRFWALYKAKAVPYIERRGMVLSDHMPLIDCDDVPKLTDFAGQNDFIATTLAAVSKLRLDADAPLRLIVIDTLSASAAFRDANDAAEAQKAFDALKEIAKASGAFVLVIDHLGKNAELGPRGSSAKGDNIDVLLQINGERGQTEGLELEVVKLRGGSGGLKLPFSLKLVEQGVDEDGDEITERIVDWGGERQSLKSTSRQPRSVQMLVRAICDLEPEGKTNPRGDIWVRAVEEVRLREEFYKRYTAAGDESHRNAKYNAFRRAIELGLHSRVLDKQEYPDGRSLVWAVAHVTNAANASSDAVEQ